MAESTWGPHLPTKGLADKDGWSYARIDNPHAPVGEIYTMYFRFKNGKVEERAFEFLGKRTVKALVDRHEWEDIDLIFHRNAPSWIIVAGWSEVERDIWEKKLGEGWIVHSSGTKEVLG